MVLNILYITLFVEENAIKNCKILFFVRILVGAPQAAGRGLLTGTRPGALFRCPITPEEYDCERVNIDGEGEFVLSLENSTSN